VFSTVGSDGSEVRTWATSPLNGPWLYYGGQRTYILTFPPGIAGHEPSSVSSCLSADNPTEAGAPHANFICGDDYLTEFGLGRPDQLVVFNPSCATYYLWIEVQVRIPAPDAGGESQVDGAGAGGESGSSDSQAGSGSDADAGSAE
jgi:hypothetical protein